MQKILNKFNNFQIAIILFFIIFVLHIDIILAPIGHYFSSLYLQDLNYYINIREYAANCLLSGYIPLWTLKIFSGHPFFANSETAILYPFNFIFLLLPISKAINLSFILHFFILSFSVFLWINNKISNKLVSLIVAIISVFSASFYLHACAGHLSNIITMAWFPLLLFLYDKIYENTNYKLIVPIVITISLQIFAGHFQYVYYTALVSLLYILFFCFNKTMLITFFSSYFIALFLSAIQILPSIDFYLQGSRITGILQHISIKSNIFNLITLIFPVYTQYSSHYFWETAIYIGIFNIFIILLAIFNNFQKNCIKYILLVSILYLLSYQHISDVIGTIIPLFNSFRSPIKLNFFIIILMLPILSYGLIQIISKDIKINKYFISIVFIFSIIVIVFNNNISQLVTWHFLGNTSLAVNFRQSILITGIFILLFSICLFLKRYMVVYVILVVAAIIQPILFVRNYSNHFLFNNDYKYEQVEVSGTNSDIRYFANEKYSLKYNYENMFGTAADVLKNYLDFTKYLEGSIDPTNILGILRCEYIVNEKTGILQQHNSKLLKRVNVIYNYKIEQDKNKVFSILSNKNFNFSNTVVLEKEPKYKIQGNGVGSINILHLSDNKIDIECKTDKPAIILFTDNYEKGWKAYNINNTNIIYDIIPADYIYKAISVNSGINRIRLEYSPLSFIVGMWVSIISLLLFLLGIYRIFLCKKSKILL